MVGSTPVFKDAYELAGQAGTLVLGSVHVIPACHDSINHQGNASIPSVAVALVVAQRRRRGEVSGILLEVDEYY